MAERERRVGHGALAAGVPRAGPDDVRFTRRRRVGSASVRSGPDPERTGVDLTARIGSVELSSPVMTASGTAGYGDRAGRVLRPRGDRRAWSPSRSPPSSGPATRRPACIRRRRACSTPSACRGPASSTGSTTSLPDLVATRRDRRGEHLGPLGRRLPRRRRAARRRTRPGRRRRGQPVVPEPRGSAVDLRPRPRLCRRRSSRRRPRAAGPAGRS